MIPMRDPYDGCRWILREEGCTHEARTVASAFWRALNCNGDGMVECFDPDYSELEPLMTWSYDEIREDLGEKAKTFDALCWWLYDEETMEGMEDLRRGME